MLDHCHSCVRYCFFVPGAPFSWLQKLFSLAIHLSHERAPCSWTRQHPPPPYACLDTSSGTYDASHASLVRVHAHVPDNAELKRDTEVFTMENWHAKVTFAPCARAQHDLHTQMHILQCGEQISGVGRTVWIVSSWCFCHQSHFSLLCQFVTPPLSACIQQVA